jgi:phage FluMu gp28-like protein
MFHELWAGQARPAPAGAGRGEQDGFSRHRTDIYDAVLEGLAVRIEELRAGMNDPDAWAQEFECRFVDEATAYITYEMIAACEADTATKELPRTIPEEAGEGVDSRLGPSGMTTGNEFYLGVDIGRKRDLTVFWLLDKVGDVFWTRMVRELRGASFRQQRDFLYSLLDGSYFISANAAEAVIPRDRIPHQGLNERLIRRCSMDSSGIGAQLAEEAGERFGQRVEAVAFTSGVKEDLAVTLRRSFEDRAVRIPSDRGIREDIHSVRRLTTSAGNVRFDAERTGDSHADRFWALALALHAWGSRSVALQYESVRQRDFSLSGCW